MQPARHHAEQAEPAQAEKQTDQKYQRQDKRPEVLEADREKSAQTEAAQSGTFTGKEPQKGIPRKARRVFPVVAMIRHLGFLACIALSSCNRIARIMAKTRLCHDNCRQGNYNQSGTESSASSSS